VVIDDCIERQEDYDDLYSMTERLADIAEHHCRLDGIISRLGSDLHGFDRQVAFQIALQHWQEPTDMAVTEVTAAMERARQVCDAVRSAYPDAIEQKVIEFALKGFGDEPFDQAPGEYQKFLVGKHKLAPPRRNSIW
jgi:hypothetical protein